MTAKQQTYVALATLAFSMFSFIVSCAILLAVILPKQHVLEQRSKALEEDDIEAYWQKYIAEKKKYSQQVIENERRARLKAAVLSHYNVDEKIVEEVIEHALTYEKPVFPRAEHIMAIIGIESSWRPHVRSQLEYDPAVGLTQIRPGVWKHKIENPAKLKEIKYQVKYSIEILDEYYAKLRTPEKTLIAYNVGLTAFIEKRYDTTYLKKYMREIRRFDAKG